MTFVARMLPHLDASLVLCTVFAFLLTVLVYRRIAHGRKYRWPPGPTGWPLIGCSRAVRTDANPADVTRLGKSYHPDLFTVPMLAGKRMVILNSFKSIKDAFVRQSAYTSGRPDKWAFTFLNEKHKGIGLFFETYSASWKREKRYMVRSSHQFGYGTTKSQEHILREANHLIELIKKRRGQPFELRTPLTLCMMNVSLSIFFNATYEEEDEDFKKLLSDVGVLVLDIFTLFDLEPFLPLLAAFRLHPSLRRAKQMTKNLTIFIRDHIDQHKATLDPDHPRDLADELLIEMAKNDAGGDLRDFDDEKFVWMILNLIPDQAESGPTILNLVLLTTVVFPGMQTRVSREIQHVIGDREPTLDDRGKLPYTEAVILEVLRCNTPFMLVVAHTTQQDVDILGFKIPKDTTLIPNIYAAHNDPELWGDPENFRPERFLGEDGQLVKPEYLIPFSMGQRQCFGSQMAQKEFFIFYVSLVQKFRFKIPDGDPLPDISGMNFVCPPPYRLQAELRE